MSYSWVDPHFAVLYARREEERLAERLASHLRSRVACEPDLTATNWRESGWVEQDIMLHTRLRLI
ncbi:MAG TPA: hypothetical protein VFV62_01295 [Gaiellaceae bacterium]|nr:hypothetical protein [Gaiellaceae bacterium]